MSISVTWERKDGVLTGTLDGRIDGSNANEFQSTLESAIDADDGTLILDFGKVSFISSAGLRVGLVMARKFNEPGKKFAVCALSDSVREVITISGFDQIIPVYESQAQAVKALQSE